MWKIIVVTLSAFLSGCGYVAGMLVPYTYNDEVVLENGSLKTYQYRIVGRSAGMIHTETQMLWPKYHTTEYLIHVDSTEGVLTDSQFILSLGGKEQRVLSFYKGKVEIIKSKIIVDLRYCLSKKKCDDGQFIEASINGKYKIVRSDDI